MGGRAIFRAGVDAKDAVPLSEIASVVENIFTRALRGEGAGFTVYSRGTDGTWVVSPTGTGEMVEVLIYFEGRPRMARFELVGDELLYQRDITDTAAPAKRIADDITSLEFSTLGSGNAARIGLDIALASGERIVTSVTGRQLKPVQRVVD